MAGGLLACVLSSCSHGSNESSRSSPPHPRAESSRTQTRQQELPHIGSVVVPLALHRHLVIRDRATGGHRFFLSGMQAGECLSFLKANPNTSPADVRAACPGQVVSPGKKRSRTSTRP
jgi:hypothetical protein